MKKLIILVPFLILFKSTFAQLTEQETKYDFFTLAVGGGKTFVANTAFDAWTEQNYQRKIYNNGEVYADFGAALKNIDFGGGAQWASGDFAMINFYVGHRITPLKSPITSYLNFSWFGYIDDIYSLSPVNYVRTPDEVGKHMELRYTSSFIGISSKNYFNNIKFNISRNRKVYFRTGFYADFGYRPWGAVWQYGYNKETDSQYYDDDNQLETTSTTNFVGHNVYSVPALANKFFDAGVFIAITFSTIPKKDEGKM